MNPRISRAVVFLTFLLLFSALGRAQNTSELRGRVVDLSKHPVVSAFVVIIGRDTSLMRAATTDDLGNFGFTSLPVGSYTLEVRADGFPNSQTRELRASIGQVVSIEVTLDEIGRASCRERGEI